MKTIFKICALALTCAFAACETEMIERFDEFSFDNGGYMRTVTPLSTTFTVSKANMTGTKMEMVLEAVTPDQGANFDRYEMRIRFVDATAANGNNSKAEAAFKSFAASQYAKDPQTGYPRLTVSVTGKEMMDVLALTDAQVSSGDRFEITATMFLKDGRSFNASNTGADIRGGAFYNSPFFYRVNIGN